jgi:hypothetical protein
LASSSFEILQIISPIGEIICRHEGLENAEGVVLVGGDFYGGVRRSKVEGRRSKVGVTKAEAGLNGVGGSCCQWSDNKAALWRKFERLAKAVEGKAEMGFFLKKSLNPLREKMVGRTGFEPVKA